MSFYVDRCDRSLMVQTYKTALFSMIAPFTVKRFNHTKNAQSSMLHLFIKIAPQRWKTAQTSKTVQTLKSEFGFASTTKVSQKNSFEILCLFTGTLST